VRMVNDEAPIAFHRLENELDVAGCRQRRGSDPLPPVSPVTSDPPGGFVGHEPIDGARRRTQRREARRFGARFRESQFPGEGLGGRVRISFGSLSRGRSARSAR
jgi:hypothetical protein